MHSWSENDFISGSFSSQYEKSDRLQHLDDTTAIKVPPKKLPKPTKNAHRKAAKSKAKESYKSGKFGQKLPHPVPKSLFSFAALRPSAKKNPFTYGAKLISNRLGKKHFWSIAWIQLDHPEVLL